MNDFDRGDERLFRLLAATSAPADPAVLARVRARLRDAERVPALFAWFGSPAGLVLAALLFVSVAGLSVAWTERETTRSDAATLVSSLVGDDDSYGLPHEATTVLETADSGKVTP